jgi:chromosome segregation ATPase
MPSTMAREAWTDERLDDLKEHMDEGFREVRADLRALRAEMAEVRGEMGGIRKEIGELREEVGELRGEMQAGFAALNRTLQIAAGLIGTMFVGLMGLIGTQL